MSNLTKVNMTNFLNKSMDLIAHCSTNNIKTDDVYFVGKYVGSILPDKLMNKNDCNRHVIEPLPHLNFKLNSDEIRELRGLFNEKINNIENIINALIKIYNVAYNDKTEHLILSTNKNIYVNLIYGLHYTTYKQDNYVNNKANSITHIKNSTILSIKSISLCCDLDEIILPGIDCSTVKLSVNGSEYISLDKASYNKFRNLKRMELLPYIGYNFSINYKKFLQDKFGNDIDKKWYFNIMDNEIHVYNKGTHPLVVQVIEFLTSLDKLVYHPTSITNLDYEVQEIKNIILPLKLKVIVELEY